MSMNRAAFLYDLTVRFGPDGFRGAHAIDLERVTDGDTVIAERELPPRPITRAEFGDLLVGETATLIEAADTARAERDRAVADRDAAQRELAERDQTIADLNTKLNDALEQIATLKAAKNEVVVSELPSDPAVR